MRCFEGAFANPKSVITFGTQGTDSAPIQPPRLCVCLTHSFQMDWVLNWNGRSDNAVEDDSSPAISSNNSSSSSNNSGSSSSSRGLSLGFISISGNNTSVTGSNTSNRNRFGSVATDSDIESLNSSKHSNGQHGGSTPPPSSSREKRRLSSTSSLDSSSGSDNSYESMDDTSTSIKVRMKIYGSSLFEMAIGDAEDGRGKKGLSDEDGNFLQSGHKIAATINRKTAWLLFFFNDHCRCFYLPV